MTYSEYCASNPPKQIQELVTGSMADFSKQYAIPYRTVQDWMAGKRVPPEYILRLIGYAVESNK